MANLTIMDLAEGRGLSCFGKTVDKKGLQNYAQYYIETAGKYFPEGTQKGEYFPTINSQAGRWEKEEYAHDLQLLSSQLSKLDEPNPEKLKDAFSPDPRLVISLSNYCDKNCAHCVSEASVNETEQLTFENIDTLDRHYFDIFKKVDFGRKGDPLLWKSEKRDISNVVESLASNGVNEVTIAAGIFKGRENWYEKITKRLEDVHNKQKNLNIETMITYHNYFPDMTEEVVAKKFNKTLLGCSRFSDKIIISIIGDRFYEDSYVDNVENSFIQNSHIIFEGMELSGSRKNITVSNAERSFALSIPFTSEAIHPYGRFAKKLKKDKNLKEYTEFFSELVPEPNLCPDPLIWPGMIVEPNGDINMCGSFEAIAYPNVSVVSNILKPYENVEKELLRFYDKEKKWFINNFPDIALRKKTVCKIRNNCYGI